VVVLLLLLLLPLCTLGTEASQLRDPADALLLLLLWW
jgi:hypothetical protein